MIPINLDENLTQTHTVVIGDNNDEEKNCHANDQKSRSKKLNSILTQTVAYSFFLVFLISFFRFMNFFVFFIFNWIHLKLTTVEKIHNLSIRYSLLLK